MNCTIDIIQAEAERLAIEQGLAVLLPASMPPANTSARLSERMNVVRHIAQRTNEEVLLALEEHR